MTIDRTRVLVLNYNGRELLAECLPSIIAAAAYAPVPCPVTVIDNDSRDGSRDYLRSRWPEIQLRSSPNLGLASFNEALRTCDEPVVLLLNNDVKLARDSVVPLLNVFSRHDDALFSAPLCWTFDGRVYEGLRTRVRSRFGLVQGMCRVPGFEQTIDRPDLTAAAGPVLAVDRVRFLEIGGYDLDYFPGRIEDLDLGFRGWMAGFKGYYEPRSVAYHQGLATFKSELGQSRSDQLAIRNSFLFAWKHLRGFRRASHFFWIPFRLAYWLLRGRLDLASAFVEAARRLNQSRTRHAASGRQSFSWIDRQETFFRRFDWSK